MRLDIIDYPTAWELQTELGPDPEAHRHPECSAIRTNGVLLCDCGAIVARWKEYSGKEGEQYLSQVQNEAYR